MSLYDNYDIIRQIGTGGFSRVYKAVSKELALAKAAEGKDEEDQYSIEELVAVKVVRSREYDCELKKVADNEVSILEEISTLQDQSNHIVQLVDIFREPRRIAIVMEYLAGGELFERIIARERYSEIDAGYTLKTIVDGLNAIHSIGVIHRDIKPENLVYKYRKCHEKALETNEFVNDTKDLLKLMDFGLGISLEGEDPHKDALYVGTPGYIAPEVISSGQYTAKSDIFSLGVILYILLSGRMPFPGKTSAIINTKIMTGGYSFSSTVWKNINPKAIDLIKKMLEVDPKERISGENILNHEWILETTTNNKRVKWFGTLGLEEYYTRYKFGEKIRKVLVNAGNNLKSNLNNLISKAIPTGFTFDDIKNIKKAFVDDNNEIQNPTVTRGDFRDTMSKLGFEELPLDDIFDAILYDKPITKSNQLSTKRIPIKAEDIKDKSRFAKVKNKLARLSIKRKQKSSSVKSSTRQSIRSGSRRSRSSKRASKKKKTKKKSKLFLDDIDELKDKEEDSLKLDEVLIGLSTVAAMESTESFLRFLFNLFNSKETDETKEPGLTEKGFNKVARVLANYRDSSEKNETSSKERRKKLAHDIALIFSFTKDTTDGNDNDNANEEDEDDEGEVKRKGKSKGVYITFEEFHLGVTKFGRDLFEEYLRPQWRKVSVQMDAAGRYMFGEGDENVVSRSLKYFRRIGDVIETVQDRWMVRKEEGIELEEEDEDDV